MLAKLLPLVLGLVGLGAGVGAGIALKPADHPPEPELAAGSAPCGEGDVPHPAKTGGGGHGKAKDGAHGEVPKTVFVQLDEQFVVPVLNNGRVAAMVVMSLTLEVSEPVEDLVFDRKPRLRDRFLRVMLDHANTGGFDGAFTSNGAMDTLRRSLRDAGAAELGEARSAVLVLDIGQQEV